MVSDALLGGIAGYYLQTLYITFEQKAAVREQMGARPHVHIMAVDVHPHAHYHVLVERVFDQDNMKTEPVGSSKAVHHIVHRFMKAMSKKGRPDDERVTTRQWRLERDLPKRLSYGDIFKRTKMMQE